MKVSADMEGASGLERLEEIFRGLPGFGRFRRLMAGDANAVVHGAIDGGAGEIVVSDSRGSRRSSAHCSTPTNPFLLASIPTIEPRLNTPPDASAHRPRGVSFDRRRGVSFQPAPTGDA